eukprot:TRINITY_DN12967_c0_g1_i1.p4 TRINITY_DN12967_c0_g1~~TRINITY_DN12967_c0_g1_i1.p4  ORF type:complete len:118 (+),score=42.09 TRINITY_DN12967_c0_g1_i1:83-436(+)
MALYYAPRGEVLTVSEPTHAECARSLAISAEAGRYESARAYVQESRMEAAAFHSRRTEVVQYQEAFLANYQAAQSAAQARQDRNRAADRMHYEQATTLRRWPCSPVSTAWGVRVPPQ